ncbi:MAG: hypothetical protein RR386_01360 [Bacteroidaceae bacterium]
MKEKYIILCAKVLSLLFAPFYFPVLAFLLLFMFSYLQLLPFSYKIVILCMVYFFTIALPLLSIYSYRKINGWSKHQLSKRHRRFVPYILSITCYGCFLYVMKELNMPRFMMGVIVGGLAVQMVCALINSKMKVSTHSAAAGGMVGELLAFSFVFSFNPTWWLSLAIIMTGAVASSRIILRQHNLQEVGIGVVVGFLCGFFSILWV